MAHSSWVPSSRGRESRPQEPEAAAHMGSTIRKQRVVDAAAAAQLPLSTYTVQDPSQGVVPPTMARSFFPPQNNPHMYGQR